MGIQAHKFYFIFLCKYSCVRIWICIKYDVRQYILYSWIPKWPCIYFYHALWKYYFFQPSTVYECGFYIFNPSFISTSWRLIQLKNVLRWITFKFPGIIILDKKRHCTNAPLPILVKLFGKVIFFKLEQLSNA